MKKIVILGAGAMGSAFTVPCVDNNNDVTLVGTHLEEQVINNINDNNNFHEVLKFNLPKELKIKTFDHFQNILKTKPDLLVIGVSSKGIEWAANELSKNLDKDTKILLLTKGLTIIDDKFETLVEKFQIILNKKKVKNVNISAVAGPCLASGLANKIKSSVVIANKDTSVAKEIGNMITTNYYSVEVSDDLIGVEVCAAIKNLYSMIIGASEGLSSNEASKELKNKYFLNTAASLMYRSVYEMCHFTKSLNGKVDTVYGLAGLGDLYVSAAGGRNSKMGKLLGEGYDYKNAKEKIMKNDTVEGADLALEIGKKVLKDFDRKKIPLMVSLIEAIIENKKLTIHW
jgi:glycerol-3-phosphate dehydrogenase (NAD(P)+)